MYILGIDTSLVNAVTDDLSFAVGSLGADSDGSIYQFVTANGAVAVGDVCGIDEVGDATPVTTTTSAPGTGQGLPVGVGIVALADNESGWVQRVGVIAAINVATSAAVHTDLNSTGTGGRIDDNAGAGSEVIDGVTTTSAEASNSASGVLSWPKIGRTL